MNDLATICPSKPVRFCVDVLIVVFVEFDMTALALMRRLGARDAKRHGAHRWQTVFMTESLTDLKGIRILNSCRQQTLLPGILSRIGLWPLCSLSAS